MIAKAKAISYGINDLRYITGESKHKKHPEKIYRVLDNLLPPDLDAMGIWNSMQLTLSQHRPIKNSIIRIELSPSPEHTSFYDIEDWQKLWHEFAEEFDKQTITGKDGKVRSSPTNLANSKYTVYLHMESKGKVPHLHAAICRFDENGNINNDHNIHLRAQRAAERVAVKRGWKTAEEIRSRNIPEVSRECMEVLRTMPSWSWEECTAPQKLDTFGVFFMKYNYEIRLKAVKLVLEGGLSVREAGCHLGCGRSQVHLWVTLFERHGLAGLKLRHGSYSAEFKLSVLKHMHQNHLSLLETAVHFGIPGPFVIRQWERLYQNQGAEGLRRKPQRRRPAMSKSKTKKVKLKTTPHEELLKELEYLRAENAYLKKLQALVEERIVRESGKEPKPSKD